MSKNIRTNLSVSQNFLTSRKTIDRLLRIANLTNTDNVLEIGAGKGHITKALIKKCNFVTAVELDKTLYQKLSVSLAGERNIKLINNDFLKIKLPQNEYKVFANIPFSITTDIIKKLTQSENPPVEAWLVMEKGASKRFSGKPDENLHSLLLKPFYDIEIKYYFSKDDFHPSPSVDTVLFHISKKALPDIEFSNRIYYYDFINRAYKFGVNTLMTKRQISKALRNASLPQSGETLYIQWLCLFRCYLYLNYNYKYEGK